MGQRGSYHLNLSSRETCRINPSHSCCPGVKVTSNTPTCCFCQQGHASSSCRVVTAVNQRKDILKRAGCCFVCLRRGLIGQTCRSMTRCCHCNLRHHSSICESDKRDNQPTDHPGQPNASAHAQQPTEDRCQRNYHWEY